ncbi:hypothetical protein [Streptomyces nigra]|uniref:hypothetical protein n=1 Tax=Streptomyces nigra TaxID=1827580 RepID=UPI00343D4573
MGPNDAQIVRVFSREPKGAIADITLDPKTDGEIVVEAEAGDTLHDGQGKYTVTLALRDLSDGTAVLAQVAGAAQPGLVEGSFGDAHWPDLPGRFEFVVSSAELQAHKGHLLQAYATVLYGNKKIGATSAISPVFQVLPR